VVKGPLRSPSHHCQSCNIRLRRGQRAWLVMAFPRSTAADVHGYAFAQEREYFVLERTEVTLYGAEPEWLEKYEKGKGTK
jgi:hypothetical protein